MSRIQKLCELQVFSMGKWKIESVYDDPDMARAEAGRMEYSRRYSAVRVVEETYDEVKRKTDLRTIHRSTSIHEANKRALDRSKRNREEIKAGKQEHTKVMAIKAAAYERIEARSAMKVIAILLVVLVGLGLAAMIGLRFLHESV